MIYTHYNKLNSSTRGDRKVKAQRPVTMTTRDTIYSDTQSRHLRKRTMISPCTLCACFPCRHHGDQDAIVHVLFTSALCPLSPEVNERCWWTFEFSNKSLWNIRRGDTWWKIIGKLWKIWFFSPENLEMIARLFWPLIDPWLHAMSHPCHDRFGWWNITFRLKGKLTWHRWIAHARTRYCANIRQSVDFQWASTIKSCGIPG